MAQDVALWGVAYTDVPEVRVPKQGGGMAAFHDVSDTTASAADVAQGKLFHAADGTLTTGTASGGGGGALKMGVLRPDAELWKSWTYDKWIVADEGVTIPAFNTSNVTLKSQSTLERVTIDTDNYDYAIFFRSLSIPSYSVATRGAGKFAYNALSMTWEVVNIPANKISIDGVAANEANVVTPNLISSFGAYWSGANSLGVVTSTNSTTNRYGCWVTPSVPGWAGTSKVVTLYTPYYFMRGSTTYYSQTYWNATTDIRFQYIYEMYRIPKGGPDFDGYSLKSLNMHTIDCAQSDDKTLT